MSTPQTLFGTDGIRGPVGFEPFNEAKLPAVAQAIARWIARQKPHAIVAIAGDTRTSTAWIITELANALIKKGSTVHLIGTVPTPALSAYIKQNEAVEYGIMVTASHNQYQDNGIKIMDRTGKLRSKDEHEISSHYFTNSLGGLPQTFGQLSLKDGAQSYANYVLSFFSRPFLEKKSLVIDCGHGATSHIAQKLFESVGATVHLINASPNGKNINYQSGALHPEQLRTTVSQQQAFAGFGFDGDGDRIATVTQDGAILDGDDLIAALSQHQRYVDETMVVGTVMSNVGLEQFIARQGKKFIRTPVGDKYVHRSLIDNSALLGGEHSGHIIMNDYLPVSDGIFAALRYLEVILRCGAAQLFERFPQACTSLEVVQRIDLKDPEIATTIDSFKKQLPYGRAVVRYSGTEPVLRIMVEDRDAQHAKKVCNRITQTLKQKFS